ncbi:TolC family protein [Paludibacter jiangxiensis]|uniref:Outer membrane protein TolC n=1 Tax=Paludibacter jiangxiensis TaxID=681398 RepID=A0A170ZV34_9BACT|nr:TolC family protein [Paludibacter jiangxiensis]GAT63032.1 outer membrane protein TolC [Paludibacter jiangxiensis]
MARKICVLVLSTLFATSLYSQKTLQLEECRQMAIAHNKSIQIAQENVKVAQQYKQAAFTQFFPNFSANAAYTWNQKNVSLLAEDAYLPVYSLNANGTPNYGASWNNSWTVVNGTPVPLDANGKPFNPSTSPDKIEWKNKALLPKEAMEFDMKNVFVGTIGFTQPIFMGGKIKALYDIAKYGEHLASAQQENKMTELLQEVDEDYWRVVSLESKVALAKEYKGLIAKMDSDIRTMVDEGVATKADALKVRVKLNEADVALTKAEDGLNLSRMALNQVCGMPLDEQYRLADQSLDTKAVEPQLIPIDQALANRPEIKALTQMQSIAKANQKAMFSRFLPNIALTGNYLVSNPNSFNGFETKFGGMFTVGVVANIPLFHFGDKLHTLNAAKSQYRIATLQLQEAKEKMELQIKQSSYKTAESIKKQTTTQHNIDQAVENLRYATEGFEAGVITSTDLLAAQTAWLSAKSENIDAIIDVKLCNLYLEKSLGTLKAPATNNTIKK